MSGGVQQRGEPTAVLLLHQEVQRQHEGRSILSVQQGGVLQVGTGYDKEKKHRLRDLSQLCCQKTSSLLYKIFCFMSMKTPRRGYLNRWGSTFILFILVKINIYSILLQVKELLFLLSIEENKVKHKTEISGSSADCGHSGGSKSL